MRRSTWATVASRCGTAWVARRVNVALGLAATLLSAGCGYSFSGSSVPSYLHTLAVPTFGNESLDPTIAEEVTRGLTDRFLEDNRLKVAREATADCLLEGRVTFYERRVYSYNAAQEPEAYIVVLRVAVVLKDRVKNRDLWSTERLEATATYPASAGTGTTAAEGGLPGNEQEARAAAIRSLGQDILARSLEQW
jgi:outer membrane lipopolysaccharide assembly protein LptE/RlpB